MEQRYASLAKDRLLNIQARVKQKSVAKILTFKNRVAGVDTNRDISGENFALEVYTSASLERTNGYIFRLTVGSGLTVQGSDNHQLKVEITAAQANHRPDVYFWLLISQLEGLAWLNGDWEFISGKYDGVVETTEIIVTENGEEVVIILEDGGTSVDPDDFWKTSGTTELTDDVVIDGNSKSILFDNIESTDIETDFLNIYNSGGKVGISTVGDATEGQIVMNAGSDSEGGTLTLRLNGPASNIIDTRTTKKGLRYDVSGYVTDNQSLTDKQYVDAKISNTITNGVTTIAPSENAVFDALAAKQGSLTLTTTGSSGAATLVGDTLNIPQYSGGGGSLSGLTAATSTNSINNGGYVQTWLNTKLNLNVVSEDVSAKSCVFLGNSFTEMSGTPLQRFSTRVITMLGCLEINHGVGGSKASDYNPANIPTYNSANHLYLFIEYGLNDKGAGVSAAQYVIDIQAIVSNATGKGWPVGNIVVLTAPGFYNPALDFTTYNSGLVTAQGSTGFILVDVTTPFTTPAIYTPYQISPSVNNHPNEYGSQILADIVYGALRSRVVVNGQGFLNDQPTYLWSLNIKNLPYLTSSLTNGLMMVDVNGRIGVSNFLPPGTSFSGVTYNYGKTIIGETNPNPTGVNANDVVMVAGSKIMSQYDPIPGVTGELELLTSGHTYFRNRFATGDISFLTSGGVNGNADHGFILDATGNINLIGTDIAVQSTNGPAFGGYYPLSNTATQSYWVNNSPGDGFNWYGNDGLGGFNFSKRYLQLKYTGATLDLPLKINNLAGVGTRNVVVDASGNLSAP